MTTNDLVERLRVETHIASCEERFEGEDHGSAPMESTSCGCECHE